MGNSSSKRITAQDRAILDLKIQRDHLRQYQKRIQVVLDRERDIAKACLAAGQKDKALRALRQRKYQEQLLSNTDKQLEALQELTTSIEFAQIQKDVFHGLKQGTAVLKEIQKEMSLEAVEKLMDETAEAQAYQREIDEMLAGTLSNQEEDEVEEELERMMREEAAKHEQPVPELPLPPQHTPELSKEEEEARRKERARARRQQLLESQGEPERQAIPA